MAQRAKSGGTASGDARFQGTNVRRPQATTGPTEYLVTSVGETPAEERARRMRSYYVAMSLRLLCVASLAFVRGWWIIIPAAGAILLPYFAVMIGNAIGSREGEAPAELSPQALTGAPIDPLGDEGHDPRPLLIVVDAPAERRSSASSAQGTDPSPPRVDSSEASLEPGEAAQ